MDNEINEKFKIPNFPPYSRFGGQEPDLGRPTNPTNCEFTLTHNFSAQTKDWNEETVLNARKHSILIAHMDYNVSECTNHSEILNFLRKPTNLPSICQFTLSSLCSLL
jgi:hypothetical protein